MNKDKLFKELSAEWKRTFTYITTEKRIDAFNGTTVLLFDAFPDGVIIENRDNPNFNSIMLHLFSGKKYEDSIYWSQIYIRRADREKGLGTKISNKFIKIFMRNGIKKVRLHPSAKTFWENVAKNNNDIEFEFE